MIKYVEFKTVKVPCAKCKGEGWVWVKHYHNQVTKMPCIVCVAGLVDVTEETDVTAIVLPIISTIRMNSRKLTADPGCNELAS